MCAATAGVFALLASATIAGAQQPPASSTAAPEGSSAAVPKNDAAPPADTAVKSDGDTKAPSACKGLAERPCRKNETCTWIIPKEADKTGQVPPAYCRKLGPTKAKAKNTAAPPAPTPEQKPPATSGAPPKN